MGWGITIIGSGAAGGGVGASATGVCVTTGGGMRGGATQAASRAGKSRTETQAAALIMAIPLCPLTDDYDSLPTSKTSQTASGPQPVSRMRAAFSWARKV